MSGATMPLRLGIVASGRKTAAVTPGCPRSGPKWMPMPSWRWEPQTKQSENRLARPWPGWRREASRASASVGRTGGCASTSSIGRARAIDRAVLADVDLAVLVEADVERDAERRRREQRHLRGPVDQLADRAARVAAVRGAGRPVEAGVEDEAGGGDLEHHGRRRRAAVGYSRHTGAVRIDHAIWATRDLDAAAEQFERDHGLAAAGGGRHDGMGTHNRIVPLGGGYLELLAVADAGEAAGSPLGRKVIERLASVGEGWMGWAVVVDDVGPVAERLGTESASCRARASAPA